jgi:hypothetical protein
MAREDVAFRYASLKLRPTSKAHSHPGYASPESPGLQ